MILFLSAARAPIYGSLEISELGIKPRIFPNIPLTEGGIGADDISPEVEGPLEGIEEEAAEIDVFEQHTSGLSVLCSPLLFVTAGTISGPVDLLEEHSQADLVGSYPAPYENPELDFPLIFPLVFPGYF